LLHHCHFEKGNISLSFFTACCDAIMLFNHQNALFKLMF